MDSTSESPLAEPAIRVATPADAPAITSGLNQVFARERDTSWVTWRLFDRPDDESRSFVAVSGGEVVAHVAYEAQPTWVLGCRETVFHLSFVYINQCWRGQGLVRKMVEPRRLGLPEGDYLSFPFESRREGFVRAGTKDLGSMPQMVRWHTGEALAASTRRRPIKHLAPVLDVGVRASLRLARYRRRGAAVVDGPGPDTAMDELATRSAGFAPRIRIRDARWVNWRWVRNPDPIGLAHVRHTDGRLSGYVAWRIDPVGGRGQIVDLLVDAPTAASALLSHAAEALRLAGASIVTFDCVDPRPWVFQEARRVGFRLRGKGSPVLARAVTATNTDDLQDWHLTLADTDRA